MDNNSSHKHKRTLGVFALSMIGIVAILSSRNIPFIAVYGVSSITYFVLGALLFLIPTYMICTELSTAWPEAGGFYAWIKEALGERLALVSIWLEWINTVCAIPASLTFILFTLIYPFAHLIANNRFYEFGLMTSLFWAMTLLNFLGIKASTRLSEVGAALGCLLVLGLIIFLGGFWLLHGHPSQIHFTWKALVPSLHFSNLAFLIIVINGLSGIEIIAFHAKDTREPKINYPIAGRWITVVVLGLYTLATLAVAVVMPNNGSLAGGIVKSLTTFLTAFHLSWLMPILAVFISLGALASTNTWVVGASKGMLAAAESGQLPKIFAHKNKKNAPTTLLITQAIVGTLLAGAYIYMPSLNSAYWLLSDMTAQFTMVMWLLIFASAIILRYKRADVLRSYRVPGGNFGIWLAASIGAIVCLTVLVFSYIPPSSVIHSNSVFRYEAVLIGGLILFSIIPLIYAKFSSS